MVIKEYFENTFGKIIKMSTSVSKLVIFSDVGERHRHVSGASTSDGDGNV